MKKRAAAFVIAMFMICLASLSPGVAMAEGEESEQPVSEEQVQADDQSQETGEGQEAEESQEGAETEEQQEPIQMAEKEDLSKRLAACQKIAENAKFAMYFNSTNADILIQDKASGYIWSTIPPNYENEQAAMKMRSMGHIEIVVAEGENRNDSTHNCYVRSIAKGTWKYNLIKDGIRIDYEYEGKFIKLSVEFTLTDYGLLLRIPHDSIEDSDELFRLCEIRTLPFFGAAWRDSEDGYLFIPDGSGALIDFKSNFSSTDFAVERKYHIYGQDKNSPSLNKPLIYETMRLPVFGIKKSETGVFGIIESGDAAAWLNMGVGSDKRGGYYRVYPGFTFRDKQELVLFKGAILTSETDTYSERNVNLVAKSHLTTDIKVRYYLLKGEEAQYENMAAIYRKYLIEQNLLRKNDINGVSFNLSLLGGLRIKKSILGIPMMVVRPMTTFEQAIDILSEMKEKGIDNINLRLLGYNKGGYRSYITKSINPEKKLGGKNGLKNLLAFANENGIKTFLGGELLEIYLRGKGFNASKDAARTLSNAIVFQFNWSVYQEKTTLGKPWILTSPRKVKSFVESFVSSAKRFGFTSVALDSIGDLLYSDQRRNNTLFIDKAIEVWRDTLKSTQEQTENLMVTGGNAYTFPYVTNIVNVPLEDSRLTLTTRTVPFYQMVIHGYIEYSGEPSNLRYNPKEQFLRMIEYGAVPHFFLMHAKSSELKRSDFNKYYSLCYFDWAEDALEEYKTVKEAYKDIYDKVMVKHEELAKGVYKTTYENGVSIIVNYNDTYYSKGGVTVKPKSFTVAKGGI